MVRFAYKVLDKDVNHKSGLVEADDIKQAVEILRKEGYMILSLREDHANLVDDLMIRFQKPKFGDISNFTRQFATMIASGLPLVEALQILRDQSKPSMARVVESVLREVEDGVSLSEAMGKVAGVFSKVYISLVRAGETAGVLDKIMLRLADTLDKQREFKSKTKGAMIYPTIVLVGMLVVIFIMMVFVVPRMTQMYQEFGANLPTSTQILISSSTFMAKFWWLIIAVVLGIVLFVLRWIKTETGGLLWEQLVFHLPIIGPLRKDILLADFARTIGLLSAAGISVLESMQIVADVLGSRIYKEGILRAASRVEKGSSLSDALVVSTDFPPILSQMVAVGEQTGKIDEILMKLASFYEQETEIKIKALMTAIEPLIMVIMGVGVGFLVFAIIMPIYNLTSQF